MSLQAQHDPKNEAEITYWNSAGGRRWVERQQSQDIVLGPILQATLERAQLRQGERVVDTGCGTGATSIALAEHVGPSGRVLGVDVSAPMLARAAERLPPGAPVKFVRADATTYRFESAEFDLLFSRFAAMFFAEPARAFANLRTALKPSGRLAFACWRKLDENPWLQVPLRAALEHVPPLPRPGPEDPGPFSFASEQRVQRILADAGFQSVILEPRDFALDIACGGGIEEALEAAMALGPTSRALQDQGPETRAAVAMSIRRALQPYQRGKQVELAGAIWLVTANNA
jgi:SAM-dependent methyltransferase